MDTMTDEHHLLPSFIWDAHTASWVPDARLNRKDGPYTSLILDVVDVSSLPIPDYEIGEYITFTVSDGVAFSGRTLTRQGSIVAIRLIGQRYWSETMSDKSGKEQGHSRAFWTQKCYGLDRIVYIVQNEDCTPWVDGYRIVGRAVQEEDFKGEDMYDFSNWNSDEQEEEETLTCA